MHIWLVRCNILWLMCEYAYAFFVIYFRNLCLIWPVCIIYLTPYLFQLTPYPIWLAPPACGYPRGFRVRLVCAKTRPDPTLDPACWYWRRYITQYLQGQIADTCTLETPVEKLKHFNSNDSVNIRASFQLLILSSHTSQSEKRLRFDILNEYISWQKKVSEILSVQNTTLTSLILK